MQMFLPHSGNEKFPAEMRVWWNTPRSSSGQGKLMASSPGMYVLQKLVKFPIALQWSEWIDKMIQFNKYIML